MKTLALALLLSPAASAANVPLPERGGFEARALEGYYGFGPCEVEGGPIWSEDAAKLFLIVQYKIDYSVNPAREEIAFFRPTRGGGPLAPAMDAEDLNAGPQERRDGEGRVYSRWESWTTPDGVFSIMAWDNPGNQGWATVHIRRRGDAVSYEMRRKRDDDAVMRVERCEMRRETKA